MISDLIGFAGKPGSGKDTCADFLVQHHGFTKTAFAKPLKECCQNLFLLNDEQVNGNSKNVLDSRYGMTPRELLQKLGTDFIREMISKTFWIDRFAEDFEHMAKPVVVSDVRFPNEADIIRRMGGIVIYVSRPMSKLQASTVPGSGHISENSDVQPDMTVLNDADIACLHKKLSSCLARHESSIAKTQLD